MKWKVNTAVVTFAEMDEEDRRRYERALYKKKDKEYMKRREADLEELVPKATGRFL